MLNELYETDPSEDEIFAKDVQMLDLINTAYLEGKLILTRYKLIFRPYHKTKVQVPSVHDPSRYVIQDKYSWLEQNKHRKNYYSIPVHMIYSVKEQVDKKNPEWCFIDILTKDYRGLRIRVVPNRVGQEIIDNIWRQAFPGLLVTGSFVLKYSYLISNYLAIEEVKEEVDSDSVCLTKAERIQPYFNGKFEFPPNGWDVYTFLEEFARQGVKKSDQKFRLVSWWSMNKEDYIIWGTYPKSVFIPNDIQDSTFRKWTMFRTKNRFPALSYYHKSNGASIWRSSQVMTGIMGQ